MCAKAMGMMRITLQQKVEMNHDTDLLKFLTQKTSPRNHAQKMVVRKAQRVAPTHNRLLKMKLAALS